MERIVDIFEESADEFDNEWREHFGTEPRSGAGVDPFEGLRPVRGRPVGTAPRTDDIAERRRYVTQMVDEGMTHEAIAYELGWDVRTIRRDVAATRDQPGE